MAKYAIDILSDDARAAEMGRQGRIRALKHFDKNTIIEQYEALYTSLVR